MPIETENTEPLLTVVPNLTTVDAIDGAGKSTIARILSKKLGERYGDDKVVLFNISNLGVGADQEKLSAAKQKYQLTGAALHKLYAAGTHLAYVNFIEPALKSKKIVVLDRSETDLLRFALQYLSDREVALQKRRLKTGTQTNKIWAGNRIFIKLSPQDAWENLKNRGELGLYDPHSLKEVQTRMSFEDEAEAVILEIPHVGDVNVIEIENPRTTPETREKADEELIESLISKLSLENMLG